MLIVPERGAVCVASVIRRLLVNTVIGVGTLLFPVRVVVALVLRKDPKLVFPVLEDKKKIAAGGKVARFFPSPVLKKGGIVLIKIVSRDLQIQEDLTGGIYATGQLARLYFSGRKKACERLKLLSDAGFIKRFAIPFLDDCSRPEFVYCKKKISDVCLVRHLLWVSEVRVCFVEWLRKSVGFSGEFIPGLKLRNVFGGALEPDAVIIVKHGNKRLLHFVEVDLGTESLQGARYGLNTKVDLYLDYFDENAYEKDFGNFLGFRVLCLLDSRKRINNFLGVLCGKQADCFFITELDLLNDSFAGDVWQSINMKNVALFGCGDLGRE